MSAGGKRGFLRNLSFAFAAQAVSLALSVLVALFLPKFLGVDEYGYWQLFLFYASYVGFFHFGLNDGVYLKFGGISYQALDKRLIGSQFRFGLLFQSVIALVAAIGGFWFVTDEARRFVWFAAVVYLLLYNASLYLGYVFQAANRTTLYSISVILDKCFFMVAVVLLLTGGAWHFQIYVILYLIAKLISLVYCVIKGREIVFAPGLSLRRSARESFDSVKIGMNLMLANIASMLILGIGRFFIDRVWGIKAFALFSLALQLTSFFLQFISQVSIVLFPALRRLDPDQRKGFYDVIGDTLHLVLPIALLLYTPVKFILGLWLQQYQESLASMALLLPICLFDGKMQMLFGTYFKVLRKERALLAINLFSMALSALLTMIGVYALKNLYFVIVSMVISIALRSVVAELYLARLLNLKAGRSIATEVLWAAAFMLLTWFLPSGWAFVLLTALYIAFLMLNRDCVKRVAKAAFKKNPMDGKAEVRQ